MPMNVRAAVFHGPGRPLSIETLQLGDPVGDEVLVKVLATGLCHTDLHIMDGHYPQAVPAVLGHESSGVVVAVGNAVTHLSVGDRVIAFLIPECGECSNCLSGKTNICLRMRERVGSDFTRFSRDGKPVHSFTGLGTFADHFVAKADRVARIRADANPEGACYASCGGATGLGSVRHAGVDAASSVAVFGLGGIGLNVVQGARLAGAPIIVGIDVNPAREAIARAMGATHFIDAGSSSDVPAAVVALTGTGATHSFECVGSPAVMRDAIDAANPFYGRCILIGVAPAGSELSASIHGLSMGKTLGGLMMGGLKVRSDLPGLVEDYAEGRVDLDSLISHRLPLEQINEGFEMMRKGESIRTVVTFEE
jgi:S-(hydroxymethyl)glutathione dehydrogenase/alcohol dehydrogenase